MCGRYASTARNAALAAEFEVDDVYDDDLPPSWNVAPTDPVRAIMQRRPREQHDPREQTAARRQLRTVRWGLVPSWSRDRGGAAKLINARSETITEKPAFRRAAARRRCLLPALGYYEWQKTDTGKVPHFLHDPDHELLAFAGLYERWPDPALPADDPDRWLWTCTIITRPAADHLGHIHDRCPVVVPPDLRDEWLDCASDGDDPAIVRHLLDRVPEPHIAPYVVSPAVGNVRNDGPLLIAPVTAEIAPLF